MQYPDALLDGSSVTVLESIPMRVIPEGSTHGKMCLVLCVESQSCGAAVLATRGSTQTCVLLGIMGANVTDVPYTPGSPSLNEPWQTVWNQLGGPPNNTLVFLSGKCC